ncbi:MAG: thiolase family protein [Patulibacter sp.]|nr:thiolase family protein [Patulibacter sp.]
MSLQGRETVIVEAVRTPVGRGHKEKGVFREIHPADLLGRAYVGLLDRAGIDPKLVDNAVAGCVYQVGEQATGITRNAWLQKGLPETTGATTVDIRCGSGQQAVHIAALQIAAGIDDVVVAGGVEHMGRVGFPVTAATQRDYGSGQTQELLDRWPLVPQGEGAELIADRWEITRDEMDAFALRSHQRAQAATESGAFSREILPVETPTDGTVTADQGIRPTTSLESLGGLKTVFRPENGRVTAGNSSQISDGASALLLMTREKADELGQRSRARIVDQVVLGVDPVTMLTGPIPATKKILARNGLTIDQIDVIEINEAFASVGLAWMRELDADPERVNPRGGAIALGHPLGATGARLMTTLLHELEDLDGRYGLVTMCCGGGLGTATLIERI